MLDIQDEIGVVVLSFIAHTNTIIGVLGARKYYVLPMKYYHMIRMNVVCSLCAYVHIHIANIQRLNICVD